ILGTFFGAVTPFCSCSTIPILAGLLNSKVPFGPSMSFLIASPLMNPVMIFMLWVLLGWKIALVYFIVLSIFSIVAGLVFSKFHLAETYKGVMVKGDGFFSNNQGSKMKQALNDAWAFLYPMLPYLFIGVFFGAFIYGFIPADFITEYASGDRLFSVIIAAVIGGAGERMPEVAMLSKLSTKIYLAAFIATVLIVATGRGLFITAIFEWPSPLRGVTFMTDTKSGLKRLFSNPDCCCIEIEK